MLSFFKTRNKVIFSGGKGNFSLQNAWAETQDILSHETLILPLLSDLLSNIKKINQQRFPEAFRAPRLPVASGIFCNLTTALKAYKRLNCFTFSHLWVPPSLPSLLTTLNFTGVSPRVAVCQLPPDRGGRHKSQSSRSCFPDCCYTSPDQKAQLLSVLVTREGLSQSGWPHSKSKTKVMFFHASACNTCLYYISVPILCKTVGLDVLKGLFPT